MKPTITAQNPTPPHAVKDGAESHSESRASMGMASRGRDLKVTTASPRMQAVLRQAQQYAPSDACILLRGETGVGKDYLARWIHQQSGRAGKFVDCQVTNFPETLLEAELFGYERGAFTGARERRAGRIEAAQNGTLFLNEVGKIPKHLQAKLFHLLDYGAFTRLGSPCPIPARVRLLAASSEDLEEAVRQGAMHTEFYYRINVLPIPIPPLRERPEDVPGLIDHFLQKHGQGKAKTLSSSALDLLQRHPFPGNVRELEHTILRANLTARGETIEATDLAFYALHAENELTRILQALHDHRYVSRAALALGLSRDALNYRLKKYGLRRR